jgi:hypothetical protein
MTNETQQARVTTKVGKWDEWNMNILFATENRQIGSVHNFMQSTLCKPDAPLLVQRLVRNQQRSQLFNRLLFLAK